MNNTNEIPISYRKQKEEEVLRSAERSNSDTFHLLSTSRFFFTTSENSIHDHKHALKLFFFFSPHTCTFPSLSDQHLWNQSSLCFYEIASLIAINISSYFQIIIRLFSIQTIFSLDEMFWFEDVWVGTAPFTSMLSLLRPSAWVTAAPSGLGGSGALLTGQTGFGVWSVGFVLRAAAQVVIHLRDRTSSSVRATHQIDCSCQTNHAPMQGDNKKGSRSTFSIKLDSLFTSWVSFWRLASIDSWTGGGGPGEKWWKPTPTESRALLEESGVRLTAPRARRGIKDVRRRAMLMLLVSGPQTKARLHIWPRPLNNTRAVLWFIFQSGHENPRLAAVK